MQTTSVRQSTTMSSHWWIFIVTS